MNQYWGVDADPTAQGRIKGARPVAVLDIGSNSVRLVVYERHARALTPLYNEKSSCALGRGMAQTGRLADANVEKALEAVKRFALVARMMRVGKVHILATSAVRDAANRDEFVSAVEALMEAPVRVLDVNNTVEPFDDPLVSQAISHAIDRQALIDVANFGYGKPLWQPFPDGYVAHNDELDDLYPYDPAKAIELLAQAGYPDGVDVELAISTDSDPLAELLQQQLNAAGIRTELVVQTPGVVNYVTLEHPFVVDQFNARQSPLQALEVLFGEQGLMNLGRNSPPELQEAIDAARAIPLDDPAYPAAVQEATKVGVTSLPNVFLFSVTRFFAHTDDVHGLVPHVDTWRFEDVWLDQ